MLHGRDVERARLTATLEAAHEGRAASLFIRGGAGVGKSALLEDTAACAHGTRVLQTVGLQSETAFPFAALHRLLRPALDRVTVLPAPQARALQVAFGERDGDQIDPFLVSLATLSLLTELAESRPVLCLIDDAQWLDAASLDALLFGARRLLAEPVTIIFAARDDDPGYVAPTDVPELIFEGISAEAMRSLLKERTGRDLPDYLLADLATHTGGNPLAAVELSTQLSTAQLDETSLLPGDLPLSARVGAHAALADALRSDDVADRYAWNRAAATDGRDEDVAQQLDAVGARAERRGGHAAASTAYKRAADLTPRDDLRARRLFAAARNAYAAGRTEHADTLLKAARPITDDRLLRADIDRLRGRIEVVGGSAVDAHRIFVAAIRDVAEPTRPGPWRWRPWPVCCAATPSTVAPHYHREPSRPIPRPKTRCAFGASSCCSPAPPWTQQRTGVAPWPRCGPRSRSAWRARTATCGQTWATWPCISGRTEPTVRSTPRWSLQHEPTAPSWRSSTR